MCVSGRAGSDNQYVAFVLDFNLDRGIFFRLGLVTDLSGQWVVTTALPIIAAQFNSATGYTWIGSSYAILSLVAHLCH